MTFGAFEESVEGSRPIEVYKFTQGAVSYNYTSGIDEVTVGASTYTPEAISRGKVGQGPEERKNVLEITVPAGNEFARQYLASVPGQRTKLTIVRVQRSDFPTPGTFQIFQGYVRSVAYVEDGKVAKIAALPISSATSRQIPRFTYQGMCNNVLGDAGCKVVLPDFKFTAQVSAQSGNTITVPGATTFADGYFTGGFVEAFAGLDDRLILAHVGDVLTLLLPFPTSVVGTNVDSYPGCAHDFPTCADKFNNGINYGGFFFVPTKNIFRTGLS